MNEDINRITWHVLKGPRVFFAILIVIVVLWALAQPGGDLILLLLLVYFSGLIFCVFAPRGLQGVAGRGAAGLPRVDEEPQP